MGSTRRPPTTPADGGRAERGGDGAATATARRLGVDATQLERHTRNTTQPEHHTRNTTQPERYNHTTTQPERRVRGQRAR